MKFFGLDTFLRIPVRMGTIKLGPDIVISCGWSGPTSDFGTVRWRTTFRGTYGREKVADGTGEWRIARRGKRRTKERRSEGETEIIWTI